MVKGIFEILNKIFNPLTSSLKVEGTLSTADAVYATRVDEVSASLTYVGKALAGTIDSDPLWQVQRIQVSGAVTTVQFADGNTNFDNIWADRASLAYS